MLHRVGVAEVVWVLTYPRTSGVASPTDCAVQPFHGFQSQLHTQSLSCLQRFSRGVSHAAFKYIRYWHSCETLLFQYSNHITDCGVQCETGLEIMK